MLTKQDYANLAALMERQTTTYQGMNDAMYAVVLYNKLKTLAEQDEVDTGGDDSANGTK